MAVREVPREEWTKDGRKWLFEIRYKGKRYKSKKYLTKKEATAAERAYYEEHPFDVFTFFHPFDALSITSTTVPFDNFVITE